MGAVMERAIRGGAQPGHQPQAQQDRDKPSPQRDHAQVNHAQRDVQHVHAGQPEESGGKLRRVFCDIHKFRIAGFARRCGEHRQGQTFGDQVGPLPAVKHHESQAARHGGEQPQALRLLVSHDRGAHRKHHGQRTGKQKRRHEGRVADALRMKRRRPVRGRDAAVGVGVQQGSEGQRVGEQEQPHPDLLGIGAEQGRLVNPRHLLESHIRHGLISRYSLCHYPILSSRPKL